MSNQDENINAPSNQDPEAQELSTAAPSVKTSGQCLTVACCPCCLLFPDLVEAWLKKLSDNKERIFRVIRILTLLWTFWGLYSQVFRFHKPAYQVGSSNEGGDSFTWSLWLSDGAIIFSPEDVPTNNANATIEYMASDRCRTFSGCLYDGPIYPTKDSTFRRFGGSGNPFMHASNWIATIAVTLCLVSMEYYGLNDENNIPEFLKKLKDNEKLREKYNCGAYSLDDMEMLWCLIKFWILSFFNCALTLPMGTAMVDGCLEAGGFFQLRHLIAVSYIFIISLISIVFCMLLFLCNVKCFDEQLGQGRLLLTRESICRWRTGGIRRQKKVKNSDRWVYSWEHPSVIAYEAVSNVLEEDNEENKERHHEAFSCCCWCCAFKACFTIRVYLKVLLGAITFLGFLIFMVSWISGLMAIVNGLVDKPILNIGQVLYWWLDVCQYLLTTRAQQGNANSSRNADSSGNTNHFEAVEITTLDDEQRTKI